MPNSRRKAQESDGECLPSVGVLGRSIQGLSLNLFSVGHWIIFSDCVRYLKQPCIVLAVTRKSNSNKGHPHDVMNLGETIRQQKFISQAIDYCMYHVVQCANIYESINSMKPFPV